MKKLAILLALAAVAVGFTSCSEERGPKYKNPTEFVLNAPAMQDQYIVLTEGNTLELTCSQPDYGYSAIANYSAEVSLSTDFANSFVITPVNNHLAAMTLKQDHVAMAVCSLYGIENVADFDKMFPDGMPFMPLYFRAVCELAGVKDSRIVSNVVSYNHIQPYFAVAQPGVVYLVGNINGWKEPSEANAAYYADWTISEDDDAIGSHIYSGVYDLPPASDFSGDGGMMFRFYTALTGWDDDSYGSQVDDTPIEYPDVTTGEFSTTVVKGKGAFKFPNFVGGKVKIVFNMSDEKNLIFEMTPVE